MTRKTATVKNLDSLPHRELTDKVWLDAMGKLWNLKIIMNEDKISYTIEAESTSKSGNIHFNDEQANWLSSLDWTYPKN